MTKQYVSRIHLPKDDRAEVSFCGKPRRQVVHLREPSPGEEDRVCGNCVIRRDQESSQVRS